MAGRKVKGCFWTHRQAQSSIPIDSKLRSRIQSPGQSEFKDWPGFLFVSPLQLQNILATDNPLAARIIFACILLGARRDVVICLKTAICFGALLLSATPVLPLQIHGLLAATPPEPLKVRDVPVLDELRFTGLRRIAPAAVAAQLKSREGAPFDAANIGKDLRALAPLGWFEAIRVEERSRTPLPPQTPENQHPLPLPFHPPPPPL